MFARRLFSAKTRPLAVILRRIAARPPEALLQTSLKYMSGHIAGEQSRL